MSYCPTLPLSARREVKPCDVKNCPCCNAATHLFATPKCTYSAYDENGGLATFILHWICGVCGCEWEHGQFESKKKGRGSMK
jgi:hypothetical protein